MQTKCGWCRDKITKQGETLCDKCLKEAEGNSTLVAVKEKFGWWPMSKEKVEN